MTPLGKVTIRFLPAPIARAGGFVRGTRPTYGPVAMFHHGEFFRTPDDWRAFRKRVAKRRAKKGYR